jgi:choline-glycine betaine transporter
MLASSIEWILIASGIITLGGGIAALLSPVLFLRLGFGVKEATDSALFFVRHWGVLIAVIGALIIYSAGARAIRTPILIAAAAEKFAIVLFVFFGPVKRTDAMTAIATVDGVFAILYAAYLAGV